MPVTLKLSEKFYDRFGHDLVGELVDWWNHLDVAYRSELREINDVNYARFRTENDARFATFEAKLDQRVTEVEARLDKRITEVEARLDQRITETKSELLRAIAETKSELTKELIKWMFVFWAGSSVTTVGLVLGVVTLLKN